MKSTASEPGLSSLRGRRSKGKGIRHETARGGGGRRGKFLLPLPLLTPATQVNVLGQRIIHCATQPLLRRNVKLIFI